jgi:tetratricopeptide (TPR) repeat protein
MCWLILIFLSGSLSAMPDSAEVVALENEQLVHPMLDRASLYLQQNDYEVALSELLQAYELTREQETSPLFVEVLNALATAYFDAGQLDQAQRYYE